MSESEMKSILLTPNWLLDDSKYPVDTARPPVAPPLEWALLHSAGSNAAIWDEYVLNRSIEDFTNALRSERPVFVVISTTPSYLYWRCPPLNVRLVERYVEAIRHATPKSKVLVIGPHGTISPEWTLSRTRADYVLRGEIDEVLIRILTGANEPCEIQHVARTGFTGSVAKEVDLSISPGMMFEDFPHLDLYAPHAWGTDRCEGIKSLIGRRLSLIIEASRGCSYNCSFCLRAGFRRVFRRRPMPQLACEIDRMRAMDVGYVFFADETFGLDWRYSSEIIALLRRSDIKFGIQTRPDLMTEPRVSELYDGGCVYVEAGLEAITQKSHHSLGKFGNLNCAYRGVELLKQKIPFVGVNIFASPWTEGEQLDDRGFIASPFVPYPELPLTKAMTGGNADYSWDDAELSYQKMAHKSRSATVTLANLTLEIDPVQTRAEFLGL